MSRICKELEGKFPYLWLDAQYAGVRVNHRVVNMALVVAIGVSESGERKVLGFEVGAREAEAFWLAFLRSLTRRGLKGARLVTSDADAGLNAALSKALAETCPGA